MSASSSSRREVRTGGDEAPTAWVTICYSAGLWCYCAKQIQVRAFYAKKDTLTPVKVSATMVTLNPASPSPWSGRCRSAASRSPTGDGLRVVLELNSLLRRKTRRLP